MSLLKTIENKLQKTFHELGYPEHFATIIESNRPDLCDFQCNAALPLAKLVKKNPMDIAQSIANTIDLPDLKVTVVNPGFLNFCFDDSMLTNFARIVFKDERHGCEKIDTTKKVFFDYGGPNVAKPLHVGHLRSGIIGETLKRLYTFVGHKVISDIHLGDWGTQMGMLIVALQDQHPEWPYFDEKFEGPYPKSSPVSLDDLQEIYPKISQRCKDDKEMLKRAREATASLQKGRPGYRALWLHFVHVSVNDMKQQYDRLGIYFDQWFGESRYEKRIPDIIKKAISLGITQESDGALIVPITKNAEDLPPLLLQKSDGGALYATTDLATIDERYHDFGAEELVYVVDRRQSLHFDQVFQASEKLGISIPMLHLGYGTMNGEDGKPFKTRSGGVMRLNDLTSMLINGAEEKLEEAGFARDFSPEERQETAQKIGISALKFADLQHDISQNYQFSLEKFLRFEGKTGPYILYAGVRVKSVLAKTEETFQDTQIHLSCPEERSLVLTLLKYPLRISRAYEKKMPNILCDHAYELAKAFSRFYTMCPILSENKDALRRSRLHICQMTLKQLQHVCYLLGMDIPDRM